MSWHAGHGDSVNHSMDVRAWSVRLLSPQSREKGIKRASSSKRHSRRCERRALSGLIRRDNHAGKNKNRTSSKEGKTCADTARFVMRLAALVRDHVVACHCSILKKRENAWGILTVGFGSWGLGKKTTLNPLACSERCTYETRSTLSRFGRSSV